MNLLLASVISSAFLSAKRSRARSIKLVSPEGKRSRLIISNCRNAQHHHLERMLGRLLTNLCLLESNDQQINNRLRRVLALLNKSLIGNDLTRSIELSSTALKMVMDYYNVPCGPLILGDAEFHGFVPGCSSSSILISLQDSGWPLEIFWEHDIKAAFESCNLSVLRSNFKLLGIPNSSSLAVSIMRTDLVIRRAYLRESVYHSKDFASASTKQFPGIQPGIRNFTTNELIQGSPLSPILFILYLAATSLGDRPAESPRSHWIYGDNVYSKSPFPPVWSNCHWKEPSSLGRSGKTLGLDYEFLSDGRLFVNHVNDAYRLGVQRKLDSYVTGKLKVTRS